MSKLLHILEELRPKLDIVDIRNPQALSQVRATALPWSHTPGVLCFTNTRVYLEKALENPQVSAIILPQNLMESLLDFTGEGFFQPELTSAESGGSGFSGCCIVTEGPEKAEELFLTLHQMTVHQLFDLPLFMVKAFCHPSVQIHPTAVVEEHVHLGAGVQVGPYAVLRNNTHIDEDCWIGSHVVLGEEAFYSRTVDGKKRHIRHFGGVRLGKNCRISAHCVINASTYYGTFTTLENDVHLGTQVIIGHDAHLGKGVNASSQALVAGRCQVDAQAWLGPASCLSNSLHIGEKASVRLGSVVVQDVPAGADVSGNFALSHQKNILHRARLERS